ncbi:MAG: hypothetical protein V7697_29045 [Rhodococcus erythropolis]
MAVKVETVGAQSGGFDLLSLTKAGVIYRDISTGKGKIPASFDTYQVIEEGDLIMCLFDVDETPRTVGRARQHGMITGAYERFVVKNGVLAEYVNWFYLSVDNVKGLRPLYRGLRKTVPIDQFMASQFPVPPVEEQVAIVRYLAHANARIEKAIDAKRRLVALLGELDRSVENNLAGSIDAGMTDGIPIPWLGSVPPAWKTIPAKRLFKEVDRRSVTGSEGLLSLRMREGLVDANDFTETPIPQESLVGYKIVLPGDIVMNRMRAAIGLFGVASKEGLVSPDYSTMTVADGVDPDFFLHLFKTDAAMAEFRRRSNGLGTGSSGFMRLYYEDFGAISLPFPPLEVQRSVIVAIDKQRAETRPVRSRVLREIDLLQEFRTRLVADVVTGQVDVRSIAATLPDAPELIDNLVSDPDDDLDRVLNEGED